MWSILLEFSFQFCCDRLPSHFHVDIQINIGHVVVAATELLKHSILSNRFQAFPNKWKEKEKKGIKMYWKEKEKRKKKCSCGKWSRIFLVSFSSNLWSLHYIHSTNGLKDWQIDLFFFFFLCWIWKLHFFNSVLNFPLQWLIILWTIIITSLFC